MKKFTPLILLIISAGIFFTYIDPQYKIISSKQAEIDKYNAALNQKASIENMTTELAAKYSQISKSDIDRMSKLVPDNTDNVRLIVDINSLAEQHGIFIRGIQLSDEQAQAGADTPTDIAKTPYQSIILSFTFKAQYSTFKAFLHDMENSLRLIDIASVSFASADSATQGQGAVPGESDYKVSIRTYWVGSKTN